MRRSGTMRTEALSAAVAELSAAMLKDKEAREPFQLCDLRRTCEMMLASLNAAKCPTPRVTRRLSFVTIDVLRFP